MRTYINEAMKFIKTVTSLLVTCNTEVLTTYMNKKYRVS